MADIRVVAGTVPVRQTDDGHYLGVQGLRDGSLKVASWYDALALEGRVLVANMGTVTTPLTFLVTAANRPDAWIRVPSGTTILPLGLDVVLEAMAGTVTEIDVRQASNDIGSGTSSAASVGPLSLRTDAPFTSGCTARQLATGDTTAETTPVSIFRRTFPYVGAVGDAPHGANVDRAGLGFPVLVGPASWIVYIAATTTQATGFVVMKWAEVPSTSIV